ncbi:transporter substrate-binding domain-containing protein [Endozoicomonas atrinae]|uniref:transporter substrate-binding domain-containing protein n=1 Tax=Endozoicomonas atrinae TaxID=1333660 RepID=UPI003AFF9744
MKPLNLVITFLSFMTFQMGMARDLPEIISSSILRVGTTGDYAPLTLCDKQNHCEGFAIDMAQSLGKYLMQISGKPISVEFMRTSWPDLHNDLENDRFDIAMGGITRTDARSQHFLLSDNIIPSGKVVLMQKNLSSSYAGMNDDQLIEQLNTSNLHLVINPGGTNQEFTMKYLQDMRYTLTADNREPFLMLRDHQADLMITDRTEALYQIKQIPSLIIINDAMFSWTVSSKVYMSQKNSKLLISEVNRWLKTIDIQSMQERWF